jgi:hypothetical protein
MDFQNRVIIYNIARYKSQRFLIFLYFFIIHVEKKNTATRLTAGVTINCRSS